MSRLSRATVGAFGAGIGGVEAQRLRAAGQPQQHHADVLDHGEQHLAQRLGLAPDSAAVASSWGSRAQPQAAEPVQPAHQQRNVGAELALDPL